MRVFDQACLRDYQWSIVRYIIAHERCAVWAGMGVGKSVSTLTALSLLDIIEPVFPVLILAPLRVATSVWPAEVAKWEHLKHLRVSPIVGNEKARQAAARTPADIYTCNYENIEWLIGWNDNEWPYPTVVLDESTKVKAFRLRQGSQRAQALSKFAHEPVTRLIELTGTPASNGLKDLWGQMWFLDGGQRLGRTYTAFKDRWFRTGYDGYSMEPLPHAQGQIQARVADLCITITAADYMDLPPLIENDVVVDLLPAAMKLYKDMEHELFVQIAEHEVEAFGAADRTNKCLQLANGAVYTDDTGAWQEVHKAKLDALDDVIEEANGAPVLVAYQFKSDLARILARFKSARHLDANPQTIVDWNAGKIPMLVAHPKSAGHGLNLQDGGNILVYFSSGWDLELDMQILERIGPTRQAQAGHNREVYVHRIVARGTVDEMVAERRASKKSVQQILLDHMKKDKQ